MDAAEARRLTKEAVATRMGVAEVLKGAEEKIGQVARSGDNSLTLTRAPDCPLSDWNVMLGLLERAGFHLLFSLSPSKVLGDVAVVEW